MKIKKINEKKYWRSLDQLHNPKDYDKNIKDEFPEGASQMDNRWSRRNFMALMGASMALAGLSGCRRPKEKIIPYVKPPEEVIPGVSLQYATTMTIGKSAYGLLVESHEGRPTKIEGNPDHPSTRGASNSIIQASILGLYDPDRSKKILNNGKEKTWEDFISAWQPEFEKFNSNGGEGLAVLSEPFSSPSLSRLKKQFVKKFPNAMWVTFEPVSDENIIKGIERVSGKSLTPVYDYGKADIILSIDSDFTLTEPENITATLGFSSGRNLESENDKMNRLYVVESAFSNTGAIADHRLALSPQDLLKFVVMLTNQLKASGLDLPSTDKFTSFNNEKNDNWIKILAEDLAANKTKSLVVAGSHLPPEIHTLVYYINYGLGNQNNTVSYYASDDKTTNSLSEFKALVDFIDSGKVQSLVMLGGNPAYNAPVDYKFGKIIKKCQNAVHLSLYNDETSKLCAWHIPMSHYLEHWSDARSADGTASVVQPLIEPLFNGKSPVELLHLINNAEDKSGYDIVRETWSSFIKGDFEKGWRRVLHDGCLKDSQLKKVNIEFDFDFSKEYRDFEKLLSNNSNGLSVIFHLSPTVHDGRFANNGWLQELPNAVTKISWDNVAQISPATAKKYNLRNEDLISLSAGGYSVEMPVWIVPGTSENSIALELGFGRQNIGRIADGAGFNAYLLRTEDNLYFASGVSISTTGRTYHLANVQDHGSMEGRAIVREASLDDYKEDPEFAPHMVHHQPLESMFEDVKYDKGYQWAMAIDLTACTGCNACTIACQSENNIPIIGKQEVRNGREMHWIRVDRYFTGEENDPEMVHQPVACHHCELAPCEQVCPVAATVHDKEGLNTMVYNRCIGTRYCSNNCPYKVRRFNFFNFTKETPEIVKMAMNPDVTVRSRGVMEKCTYCVQRINKAKITAKKEDRLVKDGEVVTACQQACPAKAITFGDKNDKHSAVSKIKERNRNYDLLGELNIRPRTSYMAKIRNKNPKLQNV